MFAALAVIRGDHVGPVPRNWREIPRWWRTVARRAHLTRQGFASAWEIDCAVALLNALLEANLRLFPEIWAGCDVARPHNSLCHPPSQLSYQSMPWTNISPRSAFGTVQRSSGMDIAADSLFEFFTNNV